MKHYPFAGSALEAGQPDVLWLVALLLVWTQDRGIGLQQQTLVSFLKVACRFTTPLLHQLFTGFGMQISYGELTTILQRNSQKLHRAYLRLKTTGLHKSAYLQADATGAKRKQHASRQIAPQFLHVLGNKSLGLFKITKTYNSAIATMLLGKHGRKKIYGAERFVRAASP